MRTLHSLMLGVFFVLTITPVFCASSRELTSRSGGASIIESGVTDPQENVYVANRAAINSARAQSNVRGSSTTRTTNNARRDSAAPKREVTGRTSQTRTTDAGGRATQSRTVNAGGRATQSRTVRTANARTPAPKARNASTQVRSASNTRAARSATNVIAASHGATKNAVKSRTATAGKSRATSNTITRARTTSATALINSDVAAMTEQCKVQYTQCMDNFCNVLDDAQGRCSCSKNIKNYAKTSTAQKEANAALQDIAQQIQYIGLSRDEVETLFKQTEAELTMQGSSDNSQIKNSLDKIKDMIIDVKPATAANTEADTGLSFNLDGLLDFNLDSMGFDLSAMFGGNNSNMSSISNQRGEQLYKTASARCKKTVLDTCQAQGINTTLIANTYDMEIDRACIAYERSLSDGNDDIVQTVRNAQSVLQRARLMVEQQKNLYDLRGCVGALDACMQDEFVCGSDYELCLDPTGKYIVEGAVVVGSTPGYIIETASNVSPSAVYDSSALMGTWYYDNKYAWGATKQDGTLVDYIKKYVTNNPITNTSSIMAEYLQYKIGYNDKGKNYGMCMSVLNKCKKLTYDSKTGDYIPNNQVITEYLSRTLVQIKHAQDEILADYAEGCITDVSSCLSTNGFDTESNSKQNIAINACRAQIKTCMSVHGNSASDPDPIAMRNWVLSMVGALTDDNDPSGGTTPDQPEPDQPEPDQPEPEQPSAAQTACEADEYGTWNGTTCECSDGEWNGTACVSPGGNQSGSSIKDLYTQTNPSSPMAIKTELVDKSTGTKIAVYEDTQTDACYANPAQSNGSYSSAADAACVVDCDISSAGNTICNEDNTVILTASDASAMSTYARRKGVSLTFNGLDTASIKIALENGQLPSSLTWVRDLAKDTDYRFDGVVSADGTEYYNQIGNRVRSSIDAGSSLTAIYSYDAFKGACRESGGSWQDESCSCAATGTIYDEETAACVCDVANNFTGTPTMMGCQCATEYEYDSTSGTCIKSKTPDQTACEADANGTWNGTTCECSDGEWNGTACVSSGGTTPDQPEPDQPTPDQPEPEQPSAEQTACEADEYGTWNGTTCDCGADKEWNDTACVSTTGQSGAAHEYCSANAGSVDGVITGMYVRGYKLGAEYNSYPGAEFIGFVSLGSNAKPSKASECGYAFRDKATWYNNNICYVVSDSMEIGVADCDQALSGHIKNALFINIDGLRNKTSRVPTIEIARQHPMDFNIVVSGANGNFPSIASLINHKIAFSQDDGMEETPYTDDEFKFMGVFRYKDGNGAQFYDADGRPTQLLKSFHQEHPAYVDAYDNYTLYAYWDDLSDTSVKGGANYDMSLCNTYHEKYCPCYNDDMFLTDANCSLNFKKYGYNVRDSAGLAACAAQSNGQIEQKALKSLYWSKPQTVTTGRDINSFWYPWQCAVTAVERVDEGTGQCYLFNSNKGTNPSYNSTNNIGDDLIANISEYNKQILIDSSYCDTSNRAKSVPFTKIIHIISNESLWIAGEYTSYLDVAIPDAVGQYPASLAEFVRREQETNNHSYMHGVFENSDFSGIQYYDANGNWIDNEATRNKLQSLRPGNTLKGYMWWSDLWDKKEFISATSETDCISKRGEFLSPDRCYCDGAKNLKANKAKNKCICKDINDSAEQFSDMIYENGQCSCRYNLGIAYNLAGRFACSIRNGFRADANATQSAEEVCVAGNGIFFPSILSPQNNCLCNDGYEAGEYPGAICEPAVDMQQICTDNNGVWTAINSCTCPADGYAWDSTQQKCVQHQNLDGVRQCVQSGGTWFEYNESGTIGDYKLPIKEHCDCLNNSIDPDATWWLSNGTCGLFTLADITPNCTESYYDETLGAEACRFKDEMDYDTTQWVVGRAMRYAYHSDPAINNYPKLCNDRMGQYYYHDSGNQTIGLCECSAKIANATGTIDAEGKCACKPGYIRVWSSDDRHIRCVAEN